LSQLNYFIKNRERRKLNSSLTVLTLHLMLVKVKLSLCFNQAPRHEVVLKESRYSSTHSLTSAPDGGEWSTSHPDRFIPRERALERRMGGPQSRSGRGVG
jgi:hypothetical protein